MTTEKSEPMGTCAYPSDYHCVPHVKQEWCLSWRPEPARFTNAATAEHDERIRQSLPSVPLVHRAMIILKGLDLGAAWELAPSIKQEIHKLCEEYEAAQERKVSP